MTFSALRRDSPYVGAGAYRSAVLGATYGWRRYSLGVDAGVTSGTASPVSDAGIGDGLFLSLPYDTHTYTASLTASAGLTRRLAVSVLGRLVSSPSRTARTRTRARRAPRSATRFGALSLSLDERFVIPSVPGGTTRRNLLFLSVNRTFGSRY